MKREEIIEELRKRGYEVVSDDIYKNGIKMEAIIIKSENRVTPTIYTEPIISRAASIEQAADIAERLFWERKSVQFDASLLTDADFIMSHVRIGLEHENEHINALFRQTEYEGLLQYLYITDTVEDDTKWSVRLTQRHAESVGLNVDELWEAAQKNTFADTTITSMAQVMVELGEIDSDVVESITDFPMYVITNRSRLRGASCILNKEILKQFAEEHHCKKLVILPSSIHECILLPCDENELDIESYDTMVQEVNATQVAPEEVLLDRALVVNF